MKSLLKLADANTSALDLKLELIPNTNYAGQDAGELYWAAINKSNTFNSGIRQFLDVPTQMSLSVLSDDAVVSTAYTCDFVSGSDMAINDRVVVPVRYNVQKEFCKDTLWQTWFAQNKRRGIENSDPALNDFLGYISAFYLQKVANDVENIVWNSSTLTGLGVFALQNGFIQTAVTAGSPSIAATVITSANILAKLEAILLLSATEASSQPDYTMYMNQKMANFYRIALTNAGTSFFNQVNGEFSISSYLGITKVVIVPQMKDNQFLAAPASNLVFAADITSYNNALKVVDFSGTTLANKIGVRIDYNAGVNIITPAHVVVVA